MNMRFTLAAACMAALCACAAEKQKEPGLSAGLESQMNRYLRRVQIARQETLFTDLIGLSAFGSHAVKPIQDELLSNEDPRQRSYGVYVLSLIYRLEADPKALAAMRGAMTDRDPMVRLEAARALLETGDRSGLPELIGGLRSTDRAVRINSFLALRQAAGNSFGYNPDAAEDQREIGVSGFEAWQRGGT